MLRTKKIKYFFGVCEAEYAIELQLYLTLDLEKSPCQAEEEARLRKRAS